MDASSAALLEHLLPLMRRGADPLLLRLPARARQPSRPAAGTGAHGLCGRGAHVTLQALSAAESTTLVRHADQDRRPPRVAPRRHPRQGSGQPLLRRGDRAQPHRPRRSREGRGDRRLQSHAERRQHRDPGHPPRRDHGPRRPPRRRPQAGAAPGLGHRAHLLLPPSGVDLRGGARPRPRVSPACRRASWCSRRRATPSSSTCSSTPSCRRRPTRASSCSAAGTCTGASPSPSRLLFSDRLEESYSLLAYHYSQGRGLGEGAGVPLQGRRPGGEHRRRRRGAGPLPGGDRRLHPRLRRHLGPAGAGGTGTQDGRGSLPPGRAGAGHGVLLPGARDAGQPAARLALARCAARSSSSSCDSSGTGSSPGSSRERMTPEAVRAAEERCRVYYDARVGNMFADLNVWLLGSCSA